AAEVVERAELGMDRAMAALAGADRIRAARVVRRRNDHVVAALAVDPPDRMDRHQVHDVEAERGDLRQSSDAILKGGALIKVAALAAREHLVPGGKPRLRTIDD